jgi:hypothetical protein
MRPNLWRVSPRRRAIHTANKRAGDKSQAARHRQVGFTGTDGLKSNRHCQGARVTFSERGSIERFFAGQLLLLDLLDTFRLKFHPQKYFKKVNKINKL